LAKQKKKAPEKKRSSTKRSKATVKPMPGTDAAAQPNADATRRPLWDGPVEDEPETGWQYGSSAVLHPTERTGRRSTRFPGLNITATAAKLGVTKSHLAKVLSGINQPSISLALKLAEVLGTSLDVVIGLHQGRTVAPPPQSKPKKKV
jgi:DNA-binding XRE family transcriptional regulator